MDLSIWKRHRGLGIDPLICTSTPKRSQWGFHFHIPANPLIGGSRVSTKFDSTNKGLVNDDKRHVVEAKPAVEYDLSVPAIYIYRTPKCRTSCFSGRAHSLHTLNLGRANASKYSIRVAAIGLVRFERHWMFRIDAVEVRKCPWEQLRRWPSGRHIRLCGSRRRNRRSGYRIVCHMRCIFCPVRQSRLHPLISIEPVA